MKRRRFLLNNPTYYVDYVIKDDVVGEQYIGFLTNMTPNYDSFTKEELQAEPFVYKVDKNNKSNLAFEYYFNGGLRYSGYVNKDNYTLDLGNEVGEKVLRVYPENNKFQILVRNSSFTHQRLQKDTDNNNIIKYIDLRKFCGGVKLDYWVANEKFPQIVIGDLSQYSRGYGNFGGYGFEDWRQKHRMIDDAINFLGSIPVTYGENMLGIHIERFTRTEASDEVWDKSFGLGGNIAWSGTNTPIKNHLYQFGRERNKPANYDELRGLFYTGELNELT
ncbi:hypothetical protein [Ornithobacterium rhinotracheale]|uniref:hypothetical protein n=1 Tax=Ornithobacterium rhinotracheale TaxID=28251 RepID=UPI0040364550